MMPVLQQELGWSVCCLRPKHVCNFMTLSPKDYFLILGNGANKTCCLDQNNIYNFITLTPKDY